MAAGRDFMCVAARADAAGVEHQASALDSPDELDASLAAVPIGLHCPGPYTHTAAA